MRGHLSETTAADACRRLADRGATGSLAVDGPDGVGTVAFVDGRVVAATSPAPRSRLGDRLVGSGYLTDEALTQALALQRESVAGTRLGALLVDRGLASRDAVRLFVQEQVLDALFDVLRWRFGSYEFIEGEAADVQEIPLSVPVDEALVEVARRQQEWDELSQVIPSLDAVPSFRPGAGSAAAPLEPDEFAVLASVDGERSVRVLADDLGYGEFEAARIVYGLCLLGIVEVRAPQDEVGAALDDALAFVADGSTDPAADVPDPEADHPTPDTAASHAEAEIDLQELDDLFAAVQMDDPADVPGYPGSDQQTDERRARVGSDGVAGSPDDTPADDAAPAPAAGNDERTEEPPPPRPSAPAVGTAGAQHPTGGKDTDVSEFLRELSRLALSHDDAPARRPAPPQGGSGQQGQQAPEPARRTDSDDRGRRKRGLFGRGGS